MIRMIRGALCILCAFALWALSGCGFQLRGAYSLPYESIYLPGENAVIIGLKRQIRASEGTRIADSAKDAQATFLPSGERRESLIISLSGSGRVREKRLRYRYAYRIVDAQGRDYVPQAFVELTRDVSYADSETLAKTRKKHYCGVTWKTISFNN